MTRIQSEEGRLLLKQIESLEDTIISYKKMMSDLLYNLDGDNVPELVKISRLVSEDGRKISEIIQTVDSITLRVAAVEGEVDGLPSTIEAVISSEINDSGGVIKAYVEGKNYLTQPDADGMYTKISNLNAGIEAYIDTTQGIAKVTQAVSSTYQRLDQMGNYVLNASLNAGISTYIDSGTGQAKITSAVSGTYQRLDQMGNYATTQSVAAIEQTVTQHGSQISLVVGSGKLVDGVGNVSGGILISAINGVGSQALINFDKINITGVTTFLKASDVGSNGSTVIDGGRISTQTLSSSRITRVGSYIDLADMTAVRDLLAIGNASTGYITQLRHNSANQNFTIQNPNGRVEITSANGFRYNGADVLTTASLVAQ